MMKWKSSAKILLPIVSLLFITSWSASASPTGFNADDPYGESPIASFENCNDITIEFIDRQSLKLKPLGADFPEPSDDDPSSSPEGGDKDDDTLDDDLDGKEPPAPKRKLTTYLSCISGNIFAPRTTLLHFMESTDSKFCYWERSCGNLIAMKGHISMSGEWNFFNSMTEFIRSPGFSEITTKTNATGIYIKFAVNYEHIRRYCKDPSPKICMSGGFK